MNELQTATSDPDESVGSELLVRVSEISEVRPHPNADRLEIAIVGGWEVIVTKDSKRAGDVAIHVPPDAMVPRVWADAWGVSQYLAFKKNSDMGRVRAAKLRQVASFGFLAPNTFTVDVGTDVKDAFGITKYEPPARQGMAMGQMSSEHPLFARYTKIQNVRNYPDVIDTGEQVVATEKIHGTNSRVGFIRVREAHECVPSDGREWLPEVEVMVGSHNTQRTLGDAGVWDLPVTWYEEEFKAVVTALHITLPGEVADRENINSIIFYGEIFGAGVQDLAYGQTEKSYRVFDIAVNGRYISYEYMKALCEQHGLPTVPEVYRGVFHLDVLAPLADGNSFVGGEHTREGLVIRPLDGERMWGKGTQDPNPKRCIFKLIGINYLTRKGGTEFH